MTQNIIIGFDTNDAIRLAKDFNYYSPNIKNASIDERLNLVKFFCTRYVGSDCISSTVVFLLDTNKVHIISLYERQYLK